MAIYIEADATYQLTTSNVVVYGNTGVETLEISSGVTGVTATSSVEIVGYAASSSNVKFSRAGSTLSVHNSSNNKIYTLGSLYQQMKFSDGTYTAVAENNEVSVRGKVIQDGVGPKYLADCYDKTEVSGDGKIYMYPNQQFTLPYSDVDVFGNEGVEQLYLMSSVHNIYIDVLVNIVSFGGSISLYKFSLSGVTFSMYELDGSFIARFSAVNRELTFAGGSYPVTNSSGNVYVGGVELVDDGVIRTYDEMIGVVPEVPTEPPALVPPVVSFPVDDTYAGQLEFTDNNYVIGSPDAWGLAQGTSVPSWLSEYITCVVNNNINTSLITINEELDDNAKSITDVSIDVTRVENDNLAFASLQLSTNAELNGNTANNSILLQSTVTNDYAETMIELSGQATYDASVAAFNTTLTAYADADSALASSITTLNSTITGPDGLAATSEIAIEAKTTSEQTAAGLVTQASLITSLESELTDVDGTVMVSARAVDTLLTNASELWVPTGLTCAETEGPCLDMEGKERNPCLPTDMCYKYQENATSTAIKELKATTAGANGATLANAEAIDQMLVGATTVYVYAGYDCGSADGNTCLDEEGKARPACTSDADKMLPCYLPKSSATATSVKTLKAETMDLAGQVTANANATEKLLTNVGTVWIYAGYNCGDAPSGGCYDEKGTKRSSCNSCSSECDDCTDCTACDACEVLRARPCYEEVDNQSSIAIKKLDGSMADAEGRLAASALATSQLSQGSTKILVYSGLTCEEMRDQPSSKRKTCYDEYGNLLYNCTTTNADKRCYTEEVNVVVSDLTKLQVQINGCSDGSKCGDGGEGKCKDKTPCTGGMTVQLEATNEIVAGMFTEVNSPPDEDTTYETGNIMYMPDPNCDVDDEGVTCPEHQWVYYGTGFGALSGDYKGWVMMDEGSAAKATSAGATAVAAKGTATAAADGVKWLEDSRDGEITIFYGTANKPPSGLGAKYGDWYIDSDSCAAQATGLRFRTDSPKSRSIAATIRKRIALMQKRGN